jgi:hypothetical protein
MTRIAFPRAPKAKSLEQQKADFTSEGSPPPGKVNTSTPITPDKSKKKVVTHTPAIVHGIHKR